MTAPCDDVADWQQYLTERLAPDTLVECVKSATNITADAGGYNSDITRIVAVLRPAAAAEGTGTETPLIVKRTVTGTEAAALTLGTHREVDFYAALAPLVEPLGVLPRCYYAAVEGGGRKVLVLADLAAAGGVQAGYCYGGGSPHNWGKDLEGLTAGLGPRGPALLRAVTVAAFEGAAEMHARFWADASLAGHPALRASDWVRGAPEGAESFRAVANAAVEAWRALEADPPEGVTVGPEVRALMENCIAKLDYAAYAGMWRARPWTLVHGDFHPANCVALPAAGDGEALRVLLLDWEVVGLGSGAQDLGQYALSHMSSEARAAVEAEALEAYTRRLGERLRERAAQMEEGASGRDLLAPPTLEEVRAQYVEGGLCRWAWLFPVCASVCPPAATQYFHDQMRDFIKDHAVDVTTLGMLRP